MFLSDTEILKAIRSKELGIEGIHGGELLQPCSVDLTLGSEIFLDGSYVNLDAQNSDARWVLYPGDTALVVIEQMVKMPLSLVGVIAPKFEVTFDGAQVQGGIVNPGYEGKLIVMVHHAGLKEKPFPLFRGQGLCQLLFSRVEGQVKRPYGDLSLGSAFQGMADVSSTAAFFPSL